MNMVSPKAALKRRIISGRYSGRHCKDGSFDKGMIAARMLPRAVLSGVLFAVAATAGIVSVAPSAQAQQSEVRAVVNREAITSYQIAQRAAFLRIRRETASNEAATNELIDEALKRQEMRRRNITVPDEAIDGYVANFAQGNNLTNDQLRQAFGQAGFSLESFREFVRIGMGWSQAVQANMRQSEVMSEQDAVQRMLQQGGQKPSTTEYTLQQVIFVVPQAERGSAMGRRMAEANALRQRFSTCPATYQFAQGLRDVTVRELGRVLQPALPPAWRDQISGIPGRGLTRAQETDRGVEFIAVCDQRSVSDDRSAAMELQAREFEALNASGADPGADFLKTLRDQATIIRR